MEKKIYLSINSGQTQKIASEFASQITPGDTVLLHGELGAGKTTFVQGVARAFKIKSRVTSPSFVLVRKYKITRSRVKTLYHVDLYRVDDPAQINELGLDEIFQDPYGVVFIEWGDKTNKAKFAWEINFKVEDKNRRKISFKKNE